MAAELKLEKVNGIDLHTIGGTIDAIRKDPELGKCRFRARNQWKGDTLNRSEVTGFHAAQVEHQHKQTFEMHSDEPPILAGGDRAPNPVEHLLHALASCVTTSLVAHAAVRGIQIDELESELEGDIDLNGFLGLDPDVPKGYTDIRMKFRVKTDRENLKVLERLARFSPVYNTLTHGTRVDIAIEAN